jgi:hypothetical protein
VLVVTLCVVLVAAGVVPIARPRVAAARRGVLRDVAAVIAAGLVAGVLAAGAGGRLVMRLLALTSPDAEGSITEAGETIGEITLGGTVGFILFSGLPAGVLSGVLYALLRPLLPRGPAGGVALGALLLLLFGTRIDPLRSDNLDFVIVGPPWLAVLSFTVLAIFQGMLTVALAERWSAPQDVPRRAVVAGRIGVAVLMLVTLPGFVSAVSEIT